MNKLRKVVNNTLISLVGQAITWTSTLTLTIAYGRFLGDFKFGELYFAITFVMLIGFPLEFGFNQQVTRHIAQKPGEAVRYFSNILLIKVVFWCLLYGIILLLCWLLGYSPEERLLVAISGLTLLSTAIANIFTSLHNAFLRVIYPVGGTILEKGLSALIGIYLLKQGASVEVMAFVLLGGSLASAIWQGLWFFYLVGIHFRIDRLLIRELVRTCVPFLIYGALAVVYYRMDTVMRSLMTNTEVGGWYGAGYRLFDTLVCLPNLVVLAIMYPVFSQLSIVDEGNLKLAIEKSMNFLLFCGLPIATMMMVAASPIIGFLYHQKDFLHTTPALQGLAPGLVFLYVNTVLGTAIMSIKQEKKITYMAAIALVFNLSLNLYLIPRYQHIGAAVVTSLTELLLLCLSIAFLPRRLWPMGSLRVGAKALLASLTMALIIWKLLPLNLGIFMLLPIAMVIYLVVATVLRTIPGEDLKALYVAVRQKAQKTTAVALDEDKQQGKEAKLQPVDALLMEIDVANEVTEKSRAIAFEATEKRAAITLDLEATEKRPAILLHAEVLHPEF